MCSVLLFMAWGSQAVPAEQPGGIESIWQGVLKVSGIELRIVYKISKKPDGSLTATLDSPDQGATGIPVNKVIFENGLLTLEVTSLRAVFEGKLSEDGSQIEGTFKQGSFSQPFILKRIEKAPELRRPQEPKKPYPYEEEEVTYENKRDGIKLAGTLTLPREKGPFPAVVLISGSGPQDRNETVFSHKPFLVLADYLTNRNIAVLRVDDRGVGGSTGNISQATTAEFARDVLAGIEYLKSRPEVDPGQIGLIGHSEGGIIAPAVAVQSTDVSFIVMMAGTGLIGEEILYLQSTLIGKAMGQSDQEIEKNKTIQKRIFSVVKQQKDDEKAEEEIRKIFEEALAEMSEKEKKEMGDLEIYIKGQIKSVLSPWFRHFLTYDPKPSLSNVKCPVLAIIGEKDLQVPPKQNLPAIEEALKAGGNKNYTVKELPGLNHLFQTAKTGAVSEYMKIEETISPDALKIIGDWILKQAGRK